MKPKHPVPATVLPLEAVHYILSDHDEGQRASATTDTPVPGAAVDASQTRRTEAGDVEAVVPTEEGLGALAVDQSGFTLSVAGQEDAESHHEARESARGDY